MTVPARKTRRRNILLLTVLILLLLLVLGGGTWLVLRDNATGGGLLSSLFAKAPPPRQAPVPVGLATVQRQDVPQRLDLIGTVYPSATVTVKSRLEARVTAVRFQDGDLVRQGDILFELDDRAIQAQLRQLEAKLRSNQAQLPAAETAYERSRKLSAAGFRTPEQLDQDKARLDAVRASIDGDNAALASARLQLADTIIRAPITGRSGTIATSAGNIVRNNDQPLVILNQVDPALVSFAIPQQYFGGLKAALEAGPVTVTATPPGGQAQTSGRLLYLDNAIDSRNGTFMARAQFDNAAEILWPGMFAAVSLTPQTLRQALVVPATAVQGDSSDRFVFTVDPATGRAARRPVQLLEQRDGAVAVIESGLQEGEQVIVDGLLRVVDGALVALPGAEAEAEKPRP